VQICLITPVYRPADEEPTAPRPIDAANGLGMADQIGSL
jgi:hypothetical protein